MGDDANRRTKNAVHGVRPSGVISVHEIYPLAEAKLRLGWTDSAYREAKRRGLSVMTTGKRTYIDGQEIRRFLRTESVSSAAA